MNIAAQGKLSVADLARHFWCSQAAEYVREKEVEIQDLDSYGEVISEAESWVNSALDRGVVTPDPGRRIDDVILAYPAAKMFISLLGQEAVLRRFATGVSKYAGYMLNREENWKIISLAATAGNFADGAWRIIYQHAGQAGGVTAGGRICEWKMHFIDYISVAPSFHDNYWKLVNRSVGGGWVYLLKPDVVRLMEEALKIRISKNGLKPTRDLPPIDKLPPNLKAAVERLQQKVKDVLPKIGGSWEAGSSQVPGAGEEAYPGCMKLVIQRLAEGVGVSHTERLALVFFLIRIGRSLDDIIQVFSKAPDFDPGRTRYYVEHAMGERGGGTQYSPYGCPKLKTFGLCNPQDVWCQKGTVRDKPLRGPLHLYRVKSWVLLRTRGTQEEKK
jgi:DNA primase large subunit